MDKATILIVDDTMDNTILLGDILAVQGYHILKAFDGLEVFDVLAENPHPDLILLDIMMPEMDGLEVCEKLKADPKTKDIPIIFISALSEPGQIVEGLNAGGVDYIGKPFNMQEIIARVKIHMTIRQQHQQLQKQYYEIERLQRIVQKFISQKALESIEATLDSESAILTPPEFETMTIMFTDIANFTTISERVNPKTLISDLLIYMNILSWVVHEHNGQIDKFLGDGLFAFFENAQDALNAAYDIQQELLKFNVEQTETEHEPFYTRIGLATGDILQTTLGFDDRFEYTTIGDRVNTASRLQSKAPIGGIMMDEATYLAVGEPQNVAPDKILLKGKQEAEQTFAITPEAISVAANSN